MAAPLRRRHPVPSWGFGMAPSRLQSMRQFLVDVARRHSRVAHEAEDLAQDLIVSALRRGLALDGDAFLHSAHGAARRHGAFLARSAGRRRARELHAAIDDLDHGALAACERDVEAPLYSTLSPALRTTLLLLAAGLEKAELRSALGIDDAALRKRFQALRERGPLARPDVPEPAAHTDLPRIRRSQVELLPRFAGRLVREQRARRVVAAADPDGHGLFFAELLTDGGSTATTLARASDSARNRTGAQCSTASSRTSRSSSS